MENPWYLTERQAQTLDALIATGSLKGAARQLGVEIDGIKSCLIRARLKMNVPKNDRLQYILMWDRWRRS